MCLCIRSALSISLAVAGLWSVLAHQAAYAQAGNPVGGRGAGSQSGVSTFHPAQANSTETPTPTATAAPTDTPVASQTPTAVPTATPTSPVPAAAGLLTAARAALKSANTNHFDVKEKVNLGGLVVGAIREQGDTSQRPSELQGHVTGSLTALGKAQKLDEHHVQVGKKAWVKSRKTKGLWKSEKPTSPTASGSLLNPLDLVKGTGIKITGLKTVGAETYSRIPVWHVHGTVIAQVTQTSTTKGTVDYLVARTGGLPYRILEYVNDPKEALLLDLRVTLSAFGKKVTITAPKIGGALR